MGDTVPIIDVYLVCFKISVFLMSFYACIIFLLSLVKVICIIVEIKYMGETIKCCCC